jgi:hypothetical protein
VLSSGREQAAVDLGLQQFLRRLLGTIVRRLCMNFVSFRVNRMPRTAHAHYTPGAMQRELSKEMAAQPTTKNTKINRADPCDPAGLSTPVSKYSPLPSEQSIQAPPLMQCIEI